jgi:catecholate siderophore receptor
MSHPVPARPAVKAPWSLRAATLALAFGSAHAQTAPETPATPTPDTTLPTIKATASAERDNTRVTAGGKFETDVRDVPQSITVVDRRLLDSQAATSLKEALRNVPGITLGAGEGGVIGDNINLRGFSARTDVYLDGLRDRGQYTRDVFALDAVEVLKGPSSMLFGRGSTGGVINQVSKQPRLRDGGEVAVTGGTDDTWRATADLNRRTGETSALRVAAFGQSQRSTRDVVESEGHGVAPSWRWGIGTATEVSVSALLQRTHEIPDYGFPLLRGSATDPVRQPIDAPANAFYGYTDDTFDQEVNVLSAGWQHRLGSDTTVRARLLASENRTDARPSPLGSVVRDDGGVPTRSDDLDRLSATRSARDREIRDTSLIGQLDLTTRLQAAGMAHQLTGGLELARERSREHRYVWNTPAEDALVNLGNPVVGPMTGERALTRTVTTTADTLAVYANDTVSLAPQWKLVAGVRGERFEVSSDLVKHTLPPGFPADTTEAAAPKSETLWSPRAGVLWQPSASQTWYASYGTSFNPSAEAVNQSASTAQLGAEKNRSFELGAKLDLWDGELSLTGALFRVEKTNPRTTDATGTQVTEGLIRMDGVELGLTGRLSPTWQVFAGYTFLDGRIVESPQVGSNADAGIRAEGKTAPNAPRHNATLWTTWRVAPQWELGGGAQFASERWLNNYETAKVEGYTRFDMTAAYLAKSWELRLNLQNLTDETYFEASSAGRATPVRGRTALLTGTVRF